MPREDAPDPGDRNAAPLFQRVCLFFLVYPELLVILVVVILALAGLMITG